MIKAVKKYFFLSIALIYFPYITGTYGMLELAVMVRLPDYAGYDVLMGSLFEQQERLNQPILSRVISKTRLHLTLTYPILPLDEDLIRKFPTIKKEIEVLASSEWREGYRSRIPGALREWLTIRIKKWFRKLSALHKPLLLPFKKYAFLGQFCVAEFSMDNKEKILDVVNAIKAKLQRLFSHVTFAFDSFIPHVSLGVLNPSIHFDNIMQPTVSIPPLSITKKSEVSVAVHLKEE